MSENFTFKTIGHVRSDAKYRFDLPRQGVFAQNYAFIEFEPEPGLSVAAADLKGFERIWVLFCFHLNVGKPWKPKVRPPVSPDGRRYGVFATRSPHRRNPVGLSCVELLEVTPDGLLIKNSDMLDGTPVIDIKPYIPEADAFPEAAAGWRDRISGAGFIIEFTPDFHRKSLWLGEHGSLNFESFCRVQLSVNPLDFRRKRLTEVDKNLMTFDLGYRTWRIRFQVNEPDKKIKVLDLFSNYSESDLQPGTLDIYNDKALHRDFCTVFGTKGA